MAGPIDTIDVAVLREIARQVFGTDTRVLDFRLLGAGSGNLAYLVALSGPHRPYVFRFGQGLREDMYEAEATNYGVVASATGVRVPEIVAIDRSRSVAPTSFMVLEYLAGDEWTALCRPGHTGTTSAEKRQIRAAVGRFYADLHAVTRPATTADESLRPVLLGLAQFAVAVRDGYLPADAIDLDLVAECERVVRADAGVRTAMLSMCLSDGEIHVERHDGGYRVGFVLDLEWAGFGNRLLDISGQLLPGVGLVTLDAPVAVPPDRLRRDPFFQAYEARQTSGSLDYAALGRLALYNQLSTWGLVAGEPAPAEKKRWIRATKLPLLDQLIRRVSAGAR